MSFLYPSTLWTGVKGSPVNGRRKFLISAIHNLHPLWSSRVQVTPIMTLNFLAPEIQEQIAWLPNSRGRIGYYRKMSGALRYCRNGGSNRSIGGGLPGSGEFLANPQRQQ